MIGIEKERTTPSTKQDQRLTSILGAKDITCIEQQQRSGTRSTANGPDSRCHRHGPTYGNPG